MQPQTITIDDPVERLLFEKVRAGLAELRQAGQQAARGQVFDAIDSSALAFSRQIGREACQVVLQEQVDALEKKGRRPAAAPAVVPGRTPGPSRDL